MIISPTYTPRQAEKRMCPLYMIAQYSRNGVQLLTCDNEKCMMWRWEDFQEEKGFCGLAGKSWDNVTTVEIRNES